MDAKHTPGPWQWRDNQWAKVTNLIGNVGGGSCTDILTIDHKHDTVTGSDKALIAAAPECLAANKAAWSHLASIHFPHGTSSAECNRKIFDQLAAAIAAAETYSQEI